MIDHLKGVCEIYRIGSNPFHELLSFLVTVLLLETLTSILIRALHGKDKCLGGCSFGKMSG